MKFLILNTDYDRFLQWLYTQRANLDECGYEEQLGFRNRSLFGVADFYSRNLRGLDHQARELHANNETLQKAWAREHAVVVDDLAPIRHQAADALQKFRRVVAKSPARRLKPLLRPLLRAMNPSPRWFHEILAAQIKFYSPHVVLNQSMDGIGSRFLREMKPHYQLLVGQIAAPLPPREDFSCYDLVLSSLPNFVDHFRRLGVPSELHRFAFEPSVLSRMEDRAPDVDLSFVGSLSPAHKDRIALLEALARRHNLQIWGSGAEQFPPDSVLRRCHQGPAWGVEMYQLLRRSKMTLNHHIGVAGTYANNMRLFEATGVGTLLVTDWKQNLPELFEPGTEVVTYRSAEECSEVVRYYLEHDDERETIARAGQQRTLRDHTYLQRMKELVDIVRRFT